MKVLVIASASAALILTGCSAWEDEERKQSVDFSALRIEDFRQDVDSWVDAYFDCKPLARDDRAPCLYDAAARLEQAKTDVTGTLDEALAEASPACARRLAAVRSRIARAIESRFDASLAMATATGTEEGAEVRQMINTAFERIDAAYSSARATCG